MMSLPPLPEPAVIDRHLPTGYVIRGYTADQLREAQCAVAEECVKLCETFKVGAPSYFEIDERLQEVVDAIRAKFLKED